MAHKKKRKKKNKRFDLNVCNLDYRKLSESIVKAHNIETEKNLKELRDTANHRQNEWNRILKQKDIPPNIKWYRKFLLEIQNDICLIWNIIFLDKNDTVCSNNTYNLFDFITSALFCVYQFFLWGCGVNCVLKAGCTIYNAFSYGNLSYGVVAFEVFVCLIAAIFYLFISGVCRAAKFECQRIKDKEESFNVFSAVVAFTALIVAILDFIK